jgi:pteridine reductase
MFHYNHNRRADAAGTPVFSLFGRRPVKRWRCRICGYFWRGESPPARCPVCGAAGDDFVEAKRVSGALRTKPPAGKVALVTGGARRIGEEICRRLAKGGFSVVLTFLTARREGECLAREIGGRALRLDLARPGEFARLAAALARDRGRLDLLVHNAAVFQRVPPEAVSAADWDRAFETNLRGPFLLTQALLPLLRRSRGSVLFVGDAGASKLWPSYLPYCLSKLSLEDQARAFHKALAPRVRVGLVRPGLALAPPGFPSEKWEALRARGDVPGPDSPARVAAAVLRFARRSS